MRAVTITPPSHEAWLALRVLDVTSTESAMLFPEAGGSPYGTEFSLWHSKKKAEVVAFETNERMEWGTDLQDSIALSLARRYAVKVGRLSSYLRIEESRMGSSFDFEVVDVDETRFSKSVPRDLVNLFETLGPGLLEIKNVDRAVFRDKWIGEDKAIVPPGHIDIQVQHQLHVRELNWAAIGVLVGGNTGKLVVRMRDKPVGEAIEKRIRQFWQSQAAGNAPPPIFPGDADFVKSLYNTSVDKLFDGRGNEELDKALDDYKAALARETLAAEDKKVAQAKALQIIGDADRAYSDRYTITAGMVAECDVSYRRKAYRNWRVTAKKGS